MTNAEAVGPVLRAGGNRGLGECSTRWGVRRVAIKGIRVATAATVFMLVAVLAPPLAAATAGELDDSFGGDGTVTTAFGRADSSATAIAMQPDGRLVAVGTSGDEDSSLALARYNPDGTLDPAFGADGKVRTQISPSRDGGVGVAIQSDAKIVVAGSSHWGRRTALARYNMDGSLDPTFGSDGIVVSDLLRAARDYPAGLAIQADGRIVVVGALGVARFDAGGTLDQTFDGDGVADFPQGSPLQAAVQVDGKIVAAGYSGSAAAAVARYDLDGSLDATFGGDGFVIVTAGADLSFYGVAIQADGRIVAVGEFFQCFGGGPGAGGCESQAALVRFTSDGALDPSFGGDGGAGGFGGWASDVAIQSDGKIVAAGTTNASRRYVLGRYNPDGTADSTFSGDGVAYLNFTHGIDRAEAVSIQPDGRIVVAGSVDPGPIAPSRFGVARFLAD